METVEEAAPAGPAASPARATPVAGGASAPGCAAGAAAIDAAVEQRFDEVNKENSFLRDRVSALERKSAEQSELIANMMETHNELYQIVSLMANQLEAPPRTAGTGAPPPGWRGDVTTTQQSRAFRNGCRPYCVGVPSSECILPRAPPVDSACGAFHHRLVLRAVAMNHCATLFRRRFRREGISLRRAASSRGKTE